MHSREHFELNMIAKKCGEMTSEEALAEAIEQERLSNLCGCDNRKYPHHRMQMSIYLRYAELLEKDGK